MVFNEHENVLDGEPYGINFCSFKFQLPNELTRTRSRLSIKRFKQTKNTFLINSSWRFGSFKKSFKSHILQFNIEENICLWKSSILYIGRFLNKPIWCIMYLCNSTKIITINSWSRWQACSAFHRYL